MFPVHHRAKSLARECLQLSIGAMLQRHLPYVSEDVEVRIELPAREPDIQRRRHHAFQVSRDKRQLRLDELDACFERNRPVKHANASYVKRHALRSEEHTSELQSLR